MAAPVKHNLRIFRGETYLQRFVYLNPDKTVINLQDCSARMQVREDWDFDTVHLDLTTENGKISIVPHMGVVDIVIPEPNTAGLTIDNGVYDLELVSPDKSEVVKLAYGKVKVMPEATR